MTNSLTYKADRKCKHCSKPIPDQAHGLTEFCDREVLPDGTIKNCKDDYHIALRRVEEKPYRNLVSFHKRMSASIEALLKASGTVVTVEQINQYGIQLNKAVETGCYEGLLKFFFLHHMIEQETKKTFKITPHVYVF